MPTILRSADTKTQLLREISPFRAKAFASLITALVLGLDSLLPGDINSAIFYVFAIVVSAWAQSTSWLWGITALVATFAIVHTGAPFGSEPIGHLSLNWVDLTNRYITAAMLTVTAGFVQIGVLLRRHLDLNDRLFAEIASRELVEEALRGRDRQIRKLVESNIIGIFFWDTNNRITEANDAFLRLIGCTRNQLIFDGRDWTDFSAPEFRVANLRAIDELRTLGKCTPFETEYVRHDGSRVPVLLSATRFDETREDGAAFVLGLAERNRARKLLRRMEADFAHAARMSMLGEFTATIAHELNQPLTGVATNCGAGQRWLDRSVPNVAKASASMVRASADVERCSEILFRIRKMATKRPPEQARVIIDQVVLEALTFAQHEALSLDTTLRPLLVPGSPSVLADRIQLQQVIVNLCINALQAIEHGECVERKITIRTATPDAFTLLCAVEDSGPGIASEYLDLIFDSFFTTKEKGMGMGLRICQTIIKSHGGHIAADNSSVHGGARFYFTLPLLDAVS